ncbi:hypothetical protein D9M69_592350 [compost metagenome]
MEGRRLPAALVGSTAKHGCAHHQSLLQYQQKGGRHDIAGIATRRIEQGLIQYFDRRKTIQRCAREAAIRARSTRSQRVRYRGCSLGETLGRAIVEEKIGGIDIGRKARGVAFEQFALGALRNAEDTKNFAPVECLTRFGERRRAQCDADRFGGV